MTMRILPLTELAQAVQLRPEIEAIFFESAGTQHFTSGDERAAYRDLWLSRYISAFPHCFFAALDHEGRVAGYLAGSPVSDRPPLSGPDYYQLFSRSLIDAYPAHMHVNVQQDCRGRRVGSDLIAAFRLYCRKNDIAGFHAVTASGSGPAQFFNICGLQALIEADWGSRRIAFLAQALS